jgi:Zn-dependent protease with chaperone function
MKMDHTIARRLNGLLRRFRLFRMLWSLTIVWIVVAIVGYLMLGYGKQVNGLPSHYVQGWIAAFGIGTLGCWWYARIKLRDLRSVAELIESRFPSLEQRLTTAVELRPTEENGRFTYLQRSVISEALVHDVRNEWDSLVSMRRNRGACRLAIADRNLRCWLRAFETT